MLVVDFGRTRAIFGQRLARATLAFQWDIIIPSTISSGCELAVLLASRHEREALSGVRLSATAMMMTMTVMMMMMMIMMMLLMVKRNKLNSEPE